MKNNRIVSLLVAVIMLMALLTACGSTAPAATEDASAAEPAAAEAAVREITDTLGRTVEVPETIETVACPGLPSTRMVVYAGAVDKIAGVSDNEKMEELGAPCANVYREQLTELPSIGSGWPNFEIYQEEIVQLDPDVVVYFTSEAKEADDLQEQTGIPVVAVFATDFCTDDFIQTMDVMGELFGTKEHTDDFADFIQDCLEDLDSRTRNIPDEEKPSVYYGAVSFKGYNGIDATYAHYNPFEVIHARNVADETGGNGAMTVEKEQVAEWDPDILFINQEIPTLQILQEDRKTNPDFYAGLSAVKNDKVFGQAAYNCVYTNIELSLINAYYAAKVIYPEQFEDVDFEKKAEEILEMFLGKAGRGYLKMLDEDGLGYHPLTMFKDAS